MIAAFTDSRIAEFLPTILELAAKAALICCAALIVHVVAGRRRVLLRSAVWHVCLAALAILPLANLVLPPLTVAVWTAETPRSRPEIPPTAVGPAELDALIDFNDALLLQPERNPLPEQLASVPSSTLPPDHVRVGELAAVAAVGAYLLSALVLLIRLAGSLLAVARLRRTGIEVGDARWTAALEHWRRELGLRADVQLRQSEAAGVPLVIGWRRPMVIVPAEVVRAPDRESIDAILLHELTHVGRGDYAWNLLLRVVQAFYWPHPLVWLAGRFVRQLREEICDALCVHWMGDARDYCAILVDVASGLSLRSQVALGMAMAHSSELGRRLSRVEGCPATSRYLLSSRARAGLIIGGLMAVAGLGMLHNGLRVSAAEESARGATQEAPRRPRTEAPSDTRPDGKDDEFERRPASPQTTGTPRAPQRDLNAPLKVRVAKVQRGKLYKTTVQPASLEPFEPVSVRSRVAGIASKVLVDEGDPAKKGDVLAVIDVPDMDVQLAKDEAELAQAEAAEQRAAASQEAAEAVVLQTKSAVKEAELEVQQKESFARFRKIQLDRFKNLLETKAIDSRLVDEKQDEAEAAVQAIAAAEAKLQTVRATILASAADARVARAALSAAQLRVKAAQAELKRGKARESLRELHAPIDGVVLSRHVNVDDFVKPDSKDPLFTMATAQIITARVDVPERDAVHVQRGAPAKLDFDSLDGKPFVSKVSRVAYSIDRTTRTLPIEIALSNADGILKPGMFGRAAVAVGEIEDVLWMPVAAQFRRDPKHDEGHACFRMVDGRAVATEIKPGTIDGIQGRVEVTEGLKEGDTVILGPGLPNIGDGQAVEVAPGPEREKS